MRELDKLTARTVASISTKGRYSDGGGLWLQVGPSGNKAWLFRYVRHGRAHSMGLGAVHTINLAQARERARKARELLLDGKDPLREKRTTAAAERIAAARAMTFEQCAEEFLRVSPLAKQWTNIVHCEQWHQSLRAYAYPTLGAVDVADIDTALVLKTLLPIWETKHETASRVRGRIERVLSWAKTSGFRTGDNPAAWDNFKDILGGKREQVHHAALPYAELPAFMEELRARDGIAARALELIVLTATRRGEALGAKWSEIDFDAKVWTIPAERMKRRKLHRVPLTSQTLGLLRTLPRTGEFVFPGTGKHISERGLRDIVQVLAPGTTIHGFRSTFADWARERTSYSRDIVERCLAHAIKDKTEAAYHRGDQLEKRRRLLGEWARYCSSPAMEGTVVAFNA
jgi:integrase